MPMQEQDCLDKPREERSDTSDLRKCGSFWIRIAL